VEALRLAFLIQREGLVLARGLRPELWRGREVVGFLWSRSTDSFVPAATRIAESSTCPAGPDPASAVKRRNGQVLTTLIAPYSP